MSSFTTILNIIDELKELLKYFITRCLIKSDISFWTSSDCCRSLCMVKLIFIFGNFDANLALRCKNQGHMLCRKKLSENFEWYYYFDHWKRTKEFSKTMKIKVLIFCWKFCWFLVNNIDKKFKMNPEIDQKKNTNSMNLLTMCDLFIGWI